MSNPFSCTNQQPPSYSGVTINITNPALNIPPAMPDRHAADRYYSSQYIKGIPNSSKQYTNRMGLHAFAPSGETISQAKMPLSEHSYNASSYNYQGDYPDNYSRNTYPTDIYPPSYIDGSGYNVQVGNNDSGSKNPSNYTSYQVISSDRNGLMSAYPPEYYIGGQSYPKADNANLLPQVMQKGEEEKANEEVSDTDTSKEIISGLDERRAEEKELEKNGKKTKIISLTNEYIMSLENYLNNPNTDIRLMAAKEILTRLDEDKSRYDDAALNALLNKMLQDPNKLIRVAAMSALVSELASGNDYTVQLLKQIQQNPEADPEDVLEASQILLKRAATTEVKYTQDNNQ